MSGMDQYRDLFLAESLKHLEAVEAALTAGGGLDRHAVDGVFREIHSLKGMAASMDYRPLTELAHLLEDRLHAWRELPSSPDATEMALCQRVCDRLADMRLDLASGGDGDLDWSDLARALRPGDGAPGGDAPAAGGGPLRVRLDLDPAAGSPSARAYLILLRFRELDPAVESDPPEDELLRGGGRPQLELHVHGASRDDVERLCGTLTEVAAVTFPREGSPDGDYGRAPEPLPEPLHEPLPESGDELPEGTDPPPSPAGAPDGPKPEEDARLRLPESVQAPVRLLDDFVDLVGELTTSRNRIEETARALGSAVLKDEAERLGALVRTFHDSVMALRMLPFGLVTGGLRRLARDLAGRLGKEVELRVSGEELGLDKSILLHLSAPLSHLLRNSVDHGLEAPDERLARGKPRAGLIELRASRAKNQVEITLEDDGRGIDPGAVRRKAVDAGLVGEGESRLLGSRDLLAFLFRPGFSTRSEVTEVSGRGVGLDVVKSRIEALGGTVDVDSTLGARTRFRLGVPLSVAVIPVLTVGVGSSVVAFPTAGISSTLELQESDVREDEGGPVVPAAGGEVPLRRLADVLGLEGASPGERLPLVLLRTPWGPRALAVDRFLREEDLFIKPLQGPLRRLPGLSGYSVAGDGSIVFLLDPSTLPLT